MAGLVIIMTTTRPVDTHPLTILICFLLIYVTVLAALFFLLKLLGGLVRFSKQKNAQSSDQIIYMFASVLALAPVIMLAMQSVGALHIMEIFLVMIFEAIACFYIWKRTM